MVPGQTHVLLDSLLRELHEPGLDPHHIHDHTRTLLRHSQATQGQITDDPVAHAQNHTLHLAGVDHRQFAVHFLGRVQTHAFLRQ